MPQHSTPRTPARSRAFALTAGAATALLAATAAQLLLPHAAATQTRHTLAEPPAPYTPTPPPAPEEGWTTHIYTPDWRETAGG